mgnify:CR=1 FL=1
MLMNLNIDRESIVLRPEIVLINHLLYKFIKLNTFFSEILLVVLQGSGGRY